MIGGFLCRSAAAPGRRNRGERVSRRRDDLQQLDGRFAIAIDDRRAAIGDGAWRPLEQAGQVGPHLHLPQMRQVNFAQDVVLDQDAAERSGLAFDGLPHRGAQVAKIEPHDAKLHDRPVRLRASRILRE